LPHRTSRKRLQPETARALFPRLLRLPTLGSEVTLVWHAGEPLTLPIAAYTELFEIIAAARPPELSVQHSFQTNGTLLNSAWCDFIMRHNVRVGISLDGPRELHDRHRRRRDEGGSFDAALAGLNLLQSRGISVHAIAVLTPESLLCPDEIFAFFRDIGIRYLCLNIEEQEGIHSQSAAVGHPETVARYRSFLRRLVELNLAAGWPLDIREVDSAFGAIRAFDPATGSAAKNEENSPFAIVSVDCDGNLATFSPELLSLTHPRYGSFTLGNLLNDSFETISTRLQESLLMRDIAAGVERCRAACEWFGLCGGGAPSNKIYENGSADSTETLYCRIHRASIEIALELVERLPHDFSKTRDQRSEGENLTSILRHT